MLLKMEMPSTHISNGIETKSGVDRKTDGSNCMCIVHRPMLFCCFSLVCFLLTEFCIKHICFDLDDSLWQDIWIHSINWKSTWDCVCNCNLYHSEFKSNLLNLCCLFASLVSLSPLSSSFFSASFLMQLLDKTSLQILCGSEFRVLSFVDCKRIFLKRRIQQLDQASIHPRMKKNVHAGYLATSTRYSETLCTMRFWHSWVHFKVIMAF